MLNNRDPGQHICIVLSDRLVSKYVMGAWLQFVYMSKKTFLSDIFLPDFSFPLELFILHSTDREADDVQTRSEKEVE